MKTRRDCKSNSKDRDACVPLQGFLDSIGPSAFESSGRLRKLVEDSDDVVPSWLRKWRAIHCLALQYEDIEGIDYGLGSLFVLTSKDKVTEETISAIINSPENQPWTIKSQAANPQTIKFFIVLHDCQGNSPKTAEEPSKPAFQYLSSSYEAQYLTICFNYISSSARLKSAYASIDRCLQIRSRRMSSATRQYRRKFNLANAVGRVLQTRQWQRIKGLWQVSGKYSICYAREVRDQSTTS